MNPKAERRAVRDHACKSLTARVQNKDKIESKTKLGTLGSKQVEDHKNEDWMPLYGDT